MPQAQTDDRSGGDAPARAAKAELPKQYRPADTEGPVRERWDASGAFHADPDAVLRGERRPYAIVIPPPNVTAALHLGHALNNTIQDILARAHRMMGYETIWLPGTDHAGIATQTVVEKRVFKEEGKRRTEFVGEEGRAEFVGKIQAFKDEYERTITDQLKAMGCSCDWRRQRFTMDEICARAVREAFFRLFRDGLIYRGKRLVNWDPATQTALADDEVEMEEVDGHFSYLRYPLVHATQVVPGAEPQPVTWSELAARGYPGAEEQPPEEAAWVTVATTRPETYLGDTAVAINPRDPRAAALRGLMVRLPLVGRSIPIVEDDYVVMPAADPDAEGVDPKARYATGFLKVTPAHDENDWQIGLRHGLEIINVMAPDASISDKHGWTDVGDAHIFVGKSREEARKEVLRAFADRGLLEEQRPYRHSVGHSYRSGAAIEPYLSDQWYVKVTDDRLKGAALRAMAPEQGGGGAGVTPLGGTGVPPVIRTGLSDPYRRLAPVSGNLNVSLRNLPHFQQGGSQYLITFRVDSSELSPEERTIVLNAIRHWDGEKLELHGAVVMPDHVHALLSPFEKEPGTWHSLSEILHSIKSFTAHAINKARGTSGRVWQDETFDRIMRNAHEFGEKLRYLADNPVRKGLAADWRGYPFTWVSDEARAGRLRFPERVRGTASQPGHESVKDHRRDACATQGMEAAEAGDGALQFHPARYAKTYQTWHENIRDWCISRQLWWGHRVPVWTMYLRGAPLDDPEPFGADGSVRRELAEFLASLQALFVELRLESHIHVAVASDDVQTWLQVCSRSAEADRALLALDTFARAGGDATPLNRLLREASSRKVITDFSPLDDCDGVQQDPDVLDTWFSSALWPLSTMGWPEPEASADTRGLLEAFNPTSVLCTAREIITLWVSRMVMFNRYFRAQDAGAEPGTGAVPFRDVFIHAMIQDGEGRKMSKTLGNGVDPLDIIATHGADAMRFTLCHMTTQTQDVRMPVVRDPATGRNTSPKFDLGRNFCNKLWNAARFALSILSTSAGEGDSQPVRAADLSPVDRWMLSRLATGVEEANAALREYQFAAYAQTMYDLLWRDFCDWYLEAIKPTAAADAGQRAVLAHALETIVRLLHPIMPFVTEALWEHLRDVETAPIDGISLGPSRAGGLLCTAGWPQVAPALKDAEAEAAFERVRSLVTAIREVRSQHQVAPKRRVRLHLPGRISTELRDGLDLVRTLAGLDEVTPDAPAGDEPAVAFTFEAMQLHLSRLAEAVDAGAERERLTRQIADLDDQIAALAKRLDNPGYAQKAPPKLVEESRAQLARKREERDAAAKALERLG